MLSPDWDNLVLWQTFPSIIIFVMAQDWDNRVHGDLISINCYYLGACMLNIDLGLLRDVSCFCLCIFIGTTYDLLTDLINIPKSDLVRLSEIGRLESRLTYLIKDH